ncbi:TRS20 [Candida oxycetoniae]|uniref:TRS20 n=1 Tax=Candida oxycetoniae TaxID=497107 RepID=A0AAI9SYX5_9ASCO|nr:TRS20 [Candida oxycetoniae]KAI3405342.1 TRS20 [Candida oxycetoniae]
MSSYYFAIIGTRDNPLYEVEFSSFKNATSTLTPSSSSSLVGTSPINNSGGAHIPGRSQFTPPTKEILPFIAHSSLDLIEDQMWSSQALNLGKIDQFYGISISAYLTQGNIKFILCYDSSKEENTIKQFFQDVNDLYVKTLMNPFYNVNDAIISPDFDYKIKLVAKKYL